MQRHGVTSTGGAAPICTERSCTEVDKFATSPEIVDTALASALPSTVVASVAKSSEIVETVLASAFCAKPAAVALALALAPSALARASVLARRLATSSVTCARSAFWAD